jgi:hypothetical protein
MAAQASSRAFVESVHPLARAVRPGAGQPLASGRSAAGGAAYEVTLVLTTVDAIAFSVLRYRYKTLWAPVLAHGFNNTIGFVAFFLIGPVYGLW